MSSNFARDVVYAPWVEQALTVLLDAAVQVLVFQVDFFATRSARTEYLVLADAERAQRSLRMRDACTDVTLTLSSSFHVRRDGHCCLSLVASRGPALLSGAPAPEDTLVEHVVWSSLCDNAGAALPPPRSVEEAYQRLTAAGSFEVLEAVRQWAGCDEFGERLVALLSP